MSVTDPDAAPARRAAVGVRDVARAAGVSAQTVSRVLNDHPSIRPETRARVLAAMGELDYRVNNAARALGTRTTRTLGVIASDATLYGPSIGVAALESAARDAGRWIATAYADSAEPGSVIDAGGRLLDQGVDGLIVLAPHAATLPALVEAFPATTVAALHGELGAERQREGAALAVRHLVVLGHRRIGRVSGPADWLEAAARDAGVDLALAIAELEPGPSWRGDWSARAGAELAGQVAEAVRSDGGPTAVVVANDQMALGLMRGLQAAGLSVPEDVSVAGFDDNPDAAFYSPPLTTVRLDLAGEARRVVSAVVGEAAVMPGPPVLVARDSTSAPSRR